MIYEKEFFSHFAILSLKALIFETRVDGLETSLTVKDSNRDTALALSRYGLTVGNNQAMDWSSDKSIENTNKII